MKMIPTVEFVADVPLQVKLTKREKLFRWAKIIRESRRDFRIFHNLEHYSPAQLAMAADANSAFAAAAEDNTLHDAGLTGQTAADAMKFFELAQHELHAFSCDCGGAITNEDMARRVESIAARS